jgi:hypothetical protein
LHQYNGAESNVPSLVLTQLFLFLRGGSVVEVSRIRSILVTRDLDLKSYNDAANKITLQVIRCVLPIRLEIAYSFCFTGAETEIHKIQDDSKMIEKRTSIAAV